MRVRIQHPRGFTLVELIVVIGIMGVLAGLLMGGIMVAREAVKKSNTQALVRNVALGAKLFEQQWGYLPHDHVDDVDRSVTVVVSDTTSDAERSIAICMFLLLTRKKDGPYLEPDERDLDKDHIVTPASVVTAWDSKYNNKAPLLLDPWGKPLVYDRNRPEGGFDITDHHVKTVDIYSFGPDGEDDGGEDDDINNW